MLSPAEATGDGMFLPVFLLNCDCPYMYLAPRKWAAGFMIPNLCLFSEAHYENNFSTLLLGALKF